MGSADPSLFSPESVGGKYIHICVHPSIHLSVSLCMSVLVKLSSVNTYSMYSITVHVHMYSVDRCSNTLLN